MRSVTKILLCAAGALVASVLTACGSGNTTTIPAQIRMVNDTTSQLSLYLNGGQFVPNVAVQTSSIYVPIPPGTYTQSVASSTGSVSSTTNTLGLGTAQNYTTLAYQRNNVVYSATYTDSQALPTPGYSSVNIANVSPDAGSLDIYLVPHPYTSLAGLSPSFQSVQGLSTAITLASTNPGATPPIAYDVVITGAGKPSDIRQVLSNPNFASSQPYTLALTSTTGGALVNSVLIPQGIPIPASAFVPATMARVRVMSALPVASSIAVSATVGGVTLPTDYAPSPTHYQLVNGGSTISALTTSAGTIAAIPATTFVAGGDYTILVYGTASPYTAVVLVDSNQVIPNYASIRVINAAANGGTGVTLFVSGSQAASDVLYGTDGAPNAYSGVTPASGATLQLIGAGYNQTATGVSLVTGSVNTVLIYDTTLPPLVISDR